MKKSKIIVMSTLLAFGLTSIILGVVLCTKRLADNKNMSNTSGNYGARVIEYDFEETKKIVKEVMKDYYIRGPYIQYNLARATYGKDSPEDATSQEPLYTVCAAYTYNSVAEAFGLVEFPNTVIKTMAAARKEYKKILTAREKYEKRLTDIEYTTNLLIYYENKEKSKYIDGGSYKVVDLVKKLQPGDVVSYVDTKGGSGHNLIVYDLIYNKKGKAIDALLLNAVQGPFIRSRITGTTRLSYNFFDSSKNEYFDVISEGSIRAKKLTDVKGFFDEKDNNTIACQKYECAILRGFYNDNGKAVFNYGSNNQNYSKGKLRLEYPGLLIDKTVSKSANNGVYLEDELTYTITITNKSNVSRKYNTKTKEYDSEKKEYKDFVIEEIIDSKTSYVGIVKTKGTKSGNKITWKIDSLKPGETKTIQYKVKVKNDLSNVDKEIVSEGKFYKNGNNKVSIKLATVRNKILPKSTIIGEKVKECYNNKIKNTNYEGLKLISEVYKCATSPNNTFSNLLETLNLSKLIGKGSSPSSPRKKLSGDEAIRYGMQYYDEDIFGTDTLITTNDSSKMIIRTILNNYWGGVNFKKGEKESDASTVYLSRWDGSSSSQRAEVINKKDFKNGDILVYETKKLPEKGYKVDAMPSDIGVYAFIYLDGKFVGRNYIKQDNLKRNEFTYKYYDKSKKNCNKYLYENCSSLTSKNKDQVLEFVNYQTLFGKDYYIILRPSLIIK